MLNLEKTPSVSAGNVLPLAVHGFNFSFMSTRTARRGRGGKNAPGCGKICDQMIIVYKHTDFYTRRV